MQFDELIQHIAAAPPRDLPYPPHWMLQPQQLGPYRIIERLGTGGMGIVFRAIDTRLNRPVALKLLRHVDQRHLQAVREAQHAARITHPNIVTVYDIGEAEGVPYIAMELVHGVTLRHWIAADHQTLSARISVALQLCRAVAALHQAGVQHRDLKLDNILVLPQAEVKLLDFGLAADLQSHRHIDSDMEKLGLILVDLFAGITNKYIASVVARGTAAGFRGPSQRFGCAQDIVTALEVARDSTAQLSVNRRRWLWGLFSFCVLMAVVIVNSKSDQTTPPIPAAPVALEPTHRRLTALPLEQRIRHAEISPDGQRVAYAHGDGVTVKHLRELSTVTYKAPPGLTAGAIYWIHGGKSLLALCEHPDSSDVELFALPNWKRLLRGSYMRFSVAPDGQRLATFRDGYLEIGQLSPHIVKQRFPMSYVGNLNWSPDSRRLVLMQPEFVNGKAGVSLATTTGETPPVRLLHSSRLVQAYGGTTVTWLNDTQLLYAMSTDLGTESGVSLWTITLDHNGQLRGSPQRTATWPARMIGFLSAGAGGQLAYVRYKEQEDVWLALLEEVIKPTARSNRFVVAALRSGTRSASRLNLSLRFSNTLLTPKKLIESDFNELPSAWTADSKSLLLTADHEGSPAGYQLGLAGGTPQRLSHNTATMTWPIPSPDNPNIVFMWRISGDESNIIMLDRFDIPHHQITTLKRFQSTDANTRRFAPLTHAVRCAKTKNFCVISYVANKKIHYASFDTAGLEPKPLLTLPYDATNARRWDLSADGTMIVQIEKGAALRQINLTTQQQTVYPLPQAAEIQTVAFGCQPNTFFLTNFGPGPKDFKLLYYRVADGVRVLQQSAALVFGPVLPSPDCRQLAYGTRELDTDVWVTQLPIVHQAPQKHLTTCNSPSGICQ